jgi:2-oxoglutarate dehydrogenase E2 component (dihydrolipoamide succinyltransferase)
VGRIAKEHNIDLNLVQGTGREGRITKRDILNYIDLRNKGLAVGVLPVSTTETGLAQEPPKGPAPTPGEILPLTSIRRAIAEHMVRSKHTSPHVTTIFEIDFSSVAAHRKTNKESFVRNGANLTFTTYVVAALVQAIRTHPLVNSSWHEKGIEIKREINIGMATAINDGLIVPVIKNADELSLLAIAKVVNDLSQRARASKLLPDEVQGGTFTLTNHGVSGSLIATPIINQPQCAILGMGKIEKRVKVINDAIAIRLMAYASLTFDHRILDGAIADGFMSTFAQLIEEWN